MCIESLYFGENMVHWFIKRLAYTLTAYCYGSKSVTQPDASSKRYLWDKISC